MRLLLLSSAALLAAMPAHSQTSSADPAEPSVPRVNGFLEVPGGPIWYEMQRGEGTPMLMLHGGPGGTSCGLQILYPLSDERTVIRYDQLGTGRSGRPDDSTLWNRQRAVAEVDAVRKQLGLDELHLYGHSWGAALAAYYVLEKGGDGIKSLTLSSPLISTEKWIADANLLRSQLPAQIRNALDEGERTGDTDSEAYQAATREFYDRHVSRGDPVEQYRCDGAPGNREIYLQMWGPTEFRATGSLLDFDLTGRLREIDVPTLFITGEFDEARPDTIREFANSVKGAEVAIVPGVGHASASRAPDEYRRILRTFLNRAESKEMGDQRQD